MHRTSRLLLVAFAVASALSVIPACKSAEEREAARIAKEEERQRKLAEEQAKLQTLQAEMHSAMPAESPLRKVNLGMSEAEVATILGVPDTQWSRVTGKAFNPFNVSGKDTMRTVYLYKGVGRVEFSQGSWGKRNG